MSEQAQQDRKKAVLNTLTGLVKVSELRDRIDPKAFFMTLNANYPVLCSGNTMDLGLLWGSLSQAHEPNSLAGLFLKFSEAGEKLGFEVREPPELASLPRPDREALLGAFDRSLAAGPGQKRQGASPPPPARTPHPQPLPLPRSAVHSVPPRSSVPPHSGGLVPLPANPADDLGLEPIPLPMNALTPLPDIATEYEPTPLSEQALAEIKDEDQRRIISTLIGAVKSTEAGPSISAPQLSYFIASRFRQLFDGQHFFFTPVFEALVELEGVEEAHIYQAAARFRKWLARIGVQLVEPPWTLSPERREVLEKQASTLPVETYAPVTPRSEAPPQTKPKDSQPSTAEARQEARLKRWGLAGFAKGSKWGRVVAMTLGGMVVLAALLVTSPVSEGDADEVQAIFPVSSVRIVEGAWMGTLNKAAWLKMKDAERAKAVRELGAYLKAQNRIKGARILDPDKHSILAYDMSRTGEFVASHDLMSMGSAKPPPPPKAPAPSAPPSAPSK
ncbi:MAG: hypothetical protein U1E65_15545 [Myxococcota bacterium]